VATSHGWHALAPYEWEAATTTLYRTELLPSGTVTRLEVRHGEGLSIRARPAPPASDLPALERRLRWCLRLDEDLSEFGELCAAHPELCASALPSGGRLLRSPTLWEDVVKTILTTNTTWAQTKAMAARLVAVLGEPHPDDPALHAFPTAEAVAQGEEALVAHVRLGYRNASVLRIARDVVAGALDLEALEAADLPTAELRKRLLALPGVGPYAAATLLMLLGRYDELAVDTELRAHVKRKYFNGQPATEKEMRQVYEHWGKWRYLAYWFDPR
jgi:3-methyladenine DNA glycosylase/8-oxoguanine DNA glycosylase